MEPANRALLLSLFSRCRRLLEDAGVDPNRTLSNATLSPPAGAGSRQALDNAYFYILFVMLFYSGLAVTLFACFVSDEEEARDPYEEFTGKTQKFNTGRTAESFDFEGEGGLGDASFLTKREGGN